MIADEDRARLTDLVLGALDDIIERYGEDAELEDAVLVYEVSYPDDEHDAERLTEISSQTTTHRAAVAGGLAQAYANTQLEPWARADE